MRAAFAVFPARVARVASGGTHQQQHKGVHGSGVVAARGWRRVRARPAQPRRPPAGMTGRIPANAQSPPAPAHQTECNTVAPATVRRRRSKSRHANVHGRAAVLRLLEHRRENHDVAELEVLDEVHLVEDDVGVEADDALLLQDGLLPMNRRGTKTAAWHGMH